MKKLILFIIFAALAVSAKQCLKIQNTRIENVSSNDTAAVKTETDTTAAATEENGSETENIPKETSSENEDKKTIDSDGYIYDVYTTYDFPNSSMTIKRIKLVREAFCGYLMFFDFDVVNKSNNTVSWRIQESSNLIGYFSGNMFENKEIGGNSILYDKDFTGNRKNLGAITLNAGESYSGYKLGVFNPFTKDIKEVLLNTDDPMTIKLYYKENDIKYEIEIKLNQ